jgi:hypothetical protein
MYIIKNKYSLINVIKYKNIIYNNNILYHKNNFIILFYLLFYLFIFFITISHLKKYFSFFFMLLRIKIILFFHQFSFNYIEILSFNDKYVHLSHLLYLYFLVVKPIFNFIFTLYIRYHYHLFIRIPLILN